MLVIALYGGLVNQIRAFYIGYKFTRIFNDNMILDLSQYYNGYYRPYILDLLNIPDYTHIAVRGTLESRINFIENVYHQKPLLLKDGKELEEVYNNFIPSKIYYLINDCYYYDSFCRSHKEFFFRYIGNDLLTIEFMNMMQLTTNSKYIDNFKNITKNCESVGIHIRLKDFIQVGWITEHDYDFYRAAIQWCRERIKQPIFFVFSDDIEKAKNILGIAKDITYMTNNINYQGDIEQLFCLSKCKHKILSKKSGFSLFASTIAQNKWKLKGYTLIIEQMDLAKNAGNKEYVDNNFNKNPLYSWQDSLYNCVMLKQEEISILSKSYIKNKVDYFITKNNISNSFPELKNEERYIFLTLQTYSPIMITGMEKMAKCFAEYGNEIHFIGEKIEYICDDDNISFQWTLKKAHEAKDINESLLGFMLYPYIELNKYNNYIEFIQYICSCKKEVPTYVIVRKKKALPPLIYHKKYNVKFIFIDFSDEYEGEDQSNEDLKYLYKNADMVITFKKNIYNYYKRVSNRIIYVELKKFFPDVKIWNTKLKNLDDINKCEDKLYQYLYYRIRSFFNEKK